MKKIQRPKPSSLAYEKVSEHVLGLSGDVEQSQMFGMPTLKVNGKAFAGLFGKDMTLKLAGDVHAEALKLKGSKLFDPSGRGMAMKEWVQVPPAHSKQWNAFAESALQYVSASLKKKVTKNS